MTTPLIESKIKMQRGDRSTIGGYELASCMVSATAEREAGVPAHVQFLNDHRAHYPLVRWQGSYTPHRPPNFSISQRRILNQEMHTPSSLLFKGVSLLRPFRPVHTLQMPNTSNLCQNEGKRLTNSFSASSL